jgi:hypothetical protein
MRTCVGRVAVLVAMLAIGLVDPLSAQRASRSASAAEWPVITRDAKPWTRWWWLGSAVDKQNISEQLGQLAAAGFGGVEVTVIYGAKGADSAYIPYLSTRWVDMIAHTATEAHRLGMALDLPQGSGWRMGGPSVVPADANASLVLTMDSVRGTWRAGTRFSGDNVKRPAPGGEGPAIDPFSETATAHYLSMFAEKTASLPKGAIR